MSEEILNQLLHDGIEKVLEEAKKLGVLEPPYGSRLILPPGFEDEEESDEDEDEDDDWPDDIEDGMIEESEEDPKFIYEFGFNPVVQLGNYLHINNPVFIEKRRNQKAEAVAYLQKRGQAALKIETTFQSILTRVKTMCSGITLGPVCGSVSYDSVKLWAASKSPGQIIFEISYQEDFAALSDRVGVEVDDEIGLTGCVQIGHLHPASVVYYRAYLENDKGSTPIRLDRGEFIRGKVTTLPDPEDEVNLEFTVVGSPLFTKGHPLAGAIGRSATWARTCESIIASDSSFTVFNGGLIPQDDYSMLEMTPEGGGGVFEVLKERYMHNLGDPSLRALFTSQSLVVSMNDNVKGSAAALKKEEATMEKYEKEKRNRRKTRGEPKDPRDEKSQALQALELYLPIDIQDRTTRHIYDQMRYGPQVEVFTLDTREGTLGKTQTAWLTEQITNSTCTWKIIVSPSPLVHPLPLKKKQGKKQTRQKHTASTTLKKKLPTHSHSTTGTEEENAASTRIQAISRGRMQRRRPPQARTSAAAMTPKSPSKQAHFNLPDGGGGGRGGGRGSNRGARDADVGKGGLMDVITALGNAGVTDVVILSTDSYQPIAMAYEFSSSTPAPASHETGSTERKLEFYEFRVTPFGSLGGVPSRRTSHDNVGGYDDQSISTQQQLRAFPKLKSRSLFPEEPSQWTNASSPATSMFTKISVSSTGCLSYSVCDETGTALGSFSLSPFSEMI